MVWQGTWPKTYPENHSELVPFRLSKQQQVIHSVYGCLPGGLHGGGAGPLRARPSDPPGQLAAQFKVPEHGARAERDPGGPRSHRVLPGSHRRPAAQRTLEHHILRIQRENSRAAPQGKSMQ